MLSAGSCHDDMVSVGGATGYPLATCVVRFGSAYAYAKRGYEQA